MRSGEEHRERAAFRLAHHRGTLAADGVQNRSDVVHPLLERRRPGHAVGHAHPALVEEDQARELGHSLAVAPELRQLPADLEVRERALGVDEIDGPVPDDAVGDVHVAAPSDLYVGHAGSVSQRWPKW